MQRCYYNLEILTPLGLIQKKNSHPDVSLNAGAKIVNIKRFFCIFDNCLFHLFLFL